MLDLKPEAAQQPEPARQPDRSSAIAAAIIALVLVAFAPALDNSFVNLDDNVYVTANPMVLRGLDATSLKWALTSTVNSSWNPVTMVSHMVDVTIFGLEPRGHHLTSVVLHALNAALLFILLRRLTGHTGRALVVAVLIAAHPTRVESVAWVAERKDVLSTTFWFFAILPYIAWNRRPSAFRYCALCGMLALGLMAKPMLVTLPFTLLLLDAWPLGRIEPKGWLKPSAWWPLIREKLPLFVIVALFCAITIAVQGDAIAQAQDRTSTHRILNATHAYAWYVTQTLAPHDLAAYYPFREPPWTRLVGAIALLIAVTGLAVRLRGRAPYVLFGWLWFLGTLLPVIGLLPIGGHAWADRFTYVPSIGLLIALVWGAHGLLAVYRHSRWSLPLVATITTSVLVVATQRQIKYWESSETLFRHALAVTEDNEVAHLNLAEALAEKTTPAARDEALLHYRAALEINPTRADFHAALGGALSRFGRPRDAREALREAVRLAPDDPRMHHSLAMVLDDLGNTEDAVEHLERAIAVDDQFAPAHHGLGVLHDARGEHTFAIEHYRKALEADPNRDLHRRLGVLLGQQGSLDEAVDLLREAARRNPRDPATLFNLGVTHARLGALDEAIQALRAARAAAPNDQRIAAMLQRLESQQPRLAP